uniref:CCHC-type domain-containing protein n=1 Tax=Phytophthora ramorum TaxID=164328 RepID=H3H819_PHYRM
MEGHKVDTIRSLKFDGKNFLAYKEGLKAALRARKCWKILTGEETKPEKDGTPATKKKRKEWREKVLLLNDILTNTLDDVTRVRLAHLNKPQAKWAALVDDFEKKSFAVALFKRRELLNVEFDPDNESIRDYIHRVEAIRQELTLMQEEVSDKEMITALLTGLGEKYENMVETFDNLDDYSLQQVKIKLTSREERLNQAKAVTEAKARKQGNGQSGVGGSQFGSTQSDEKEISFVKKKRGRGGGGRGQAKRRRAEIDCHNCGKFGHYAYECRAPKKDQQQQGGKQSQGNSQGKRKRQQNDNSTCEDLPGYYNPSKTGGKKGKPVNMIEVVEEKPTPCLTSTKVENASGNSFFIPFVLDNASGVNICGCKEAFVSLTSECDTVMKWFDNSRKKAQMKGLIKFAIVDAQTKARVWITVEALYVEGATNLLSQRKLYKEYGFFAQTSKDQEVTTLTNRVKHIAWQFEMVGDLYQTMVEVPRSQPTLAVLQTSAQPTRKLRMWHYRLAHANWQVIKDMSSKEMVKGLELTKEDRCGKANCLDCDMAKMKRMSFKKATPERATVPFVKVLMDLGFLGVPTLEGNNVYLHLIDEGSRYQWLYGQKTKEETVEKLKCFRDQVSAKHHKIVNTFHSDQGTEFLNQDMSAMCAVAVFLECYGEKQLAT